MEVDSILQHFKVEPYGSFNCDFCSSSFHTTAERKTHTIEHFEKKHCLDCKKEIIRIDDDWYELHTINNCNKENFSNAANYDDDIDIDQLVKQEEFELIPTGSIDSTFLLTDTPTKCELKNPIRFEIKSVTERKTISNNVLTKKKSQKNDSQQQLQNDEVDNKPKKPGVKIKKKRIEPGTTDPFGMQICPICNKTPRNLRSLKRHIKKWHDNEHERKRKVRAADLRPIGVITCDICDRKLKDFNSTRKHMSYMHLGKKRPVIKDKKTYTCDICSTTLGCFLSLKYHMGRHSKETMYICNYCGLSFYTRPSLVAHENRHTGAKIYSCTTCGKGFRGHSNLTRHIRIHTGEKPYKCPIEGCNRKYADDIDLKRHKFGVHRIYTKKHICPICSKVYPENKLLRKHLKSQKCVQ